MAYRLRNPTNRRKVRGMDATQTLRMARSAIQHGRQATARRLLTQLVEAHPRNETAWLWLSALCEDADQEQACLERVLDINPANSIAWNHLVRLEQLETL